MEGRMEGRSDGGMNLGREGEQENGKERKEKDKDVLFTWTGDAGIGSAADDPAIADANWY